MNKTPKEAVICGLLEKLPVVIFRFSFERDKFDFLSKSSELITEYPAEEIITNSLYEREIIHPEHVEFIKIFRQQAEKGAIAEEISYKIKTKSQKTRWLRQHNKLLFDKDGKAIGIDGFAYDVTDEKLKNEFSQESEAKLRHIYENMVSGVAVMSSVDDGENFIFSDVNKAATRHLNLPRDEIIGKMVTDVIPGVIQAGILNTYRKVHKSGKSDKLPLRLYEDNRIKTWVEAYISKLPSGKVIGLFDDQTELRSAYETTLNSEKKYRKYFTDSPDAIFISGKEHNYKDVNPKAVSMTGYSKEELLQMKVSDLWATEEKIRLEGIFDVLDNKGKIDLVIKFIHKDSSEYFMTVKAVRLDEDTYIAFCQDITDRINLENKLTELNSNLKKQIAEEIEKNRKHEQAAQEQEKIEHMGQMINAIAHLWRQPINALSLYVQDICDTVKEGEADEKYLSNFESTCTGLINKLSDTIDDFRNFFVKDSNPKDFLIMKEITSLVQLITVQLDSKNIQLIPEYHCTTPHCDCTSSDVLENCPYKDVTINGYIGEFRQSVLNIVYNSVDAIEQNIENKNIDSGWIKIKAKASDNKILITIEDNGGGITSTAMSRAFEPYFSTKSEGKGTGLGLYMSKLVIEEHHKGKLKISNGDSGAVTDIEIPVSSC